MTFSPLCAPSQKIGRELGASNISLMCKREPEQSEGSSVSPSTKRLGWAALRLAHPSYELKKLWIPASAGMTGLRSIQKFTRSSISTLCGMALSMKPAT